MDVRAGAQGVGLSGGPQTAHKLSPAEKLSLQAGKRVNVTYRVTTGKNVRFSIVSTGSKASTTTVVVAICTS